MKKLFIYLKSFIDFLFLIIIKVRIHFTLKSKNNLLFINTGQIGDLIVSSTLFELDKLFLVYERFFFLMRYEYVPLFLDYKGKIEIVKIDINKFKYNPIYRLKFTSQLNKLNIKTVFNLTSLRTTWNDSLAICIDAKEKYSYANNWKSEIKLFRNYIENQYTLQISNNIFNEYDRILETVKFLTKKNNLDDVIKTQVFLLDEKFEKHKIIIAPFSFDRNRDLKIETLAKIIKKYENINILILCSSAQKNSLNSLTNFDNVQISSGNHNLNELFSVIAKASVFIGVDSGITHIALKTNTKTIAIIGGGNYGRYLPKPNGNNTIYLTEKCEYFNCEWNCKKEKVICIDNISVNSIIYEIENIINTYENS